jgi:hypothetical protein
MKAGIAAVGAEGSVGIDFERLESGEWSVSGAWTL